jgi:predicted XRE-type DNA-binding protein
MPITKLKQEDIDFIKQNKDTLKQKEIAAKFNIHQSYISKLLSGKKYRIGFNKNENSEYFDVDSFGKHYAV